MQSLEVLTRLTQPVHVVHPHAVDLSAGQPVEDQSVRELEHPWAFHPQPHQIGDVEEPPVVDLLRRRPPVRESVVLVLQDLMDGLGVVVDRGEQLVNGFCGRWVTSEDLDQLALHPIEVVRGRTLVPLALRGPHGASQPVERRRAADPRCLHEHIRQARQARR